MPAHRRQEYQASYDRVADEYVRRISGELPHKPFDCQLLDRFADRVRDFGPACDLGCGPGHVAGYLHTRGVRICGIDLSPALVERARRLHPGLDFRQGDMMALTAPDETWAGLTAFYSLIHIHRDDLPQALGELRRVLRPGGVLLLAFHLGDGALHLDEWWGHQVSVDFFLFRTEEVAAALRAAGFKVEECLEREPYPEIEHQSRRAYIFARRPETTACRHDAFTNTMSASRPPLSPKETLLLILLPLLITFASLRLYLHLVRVQHVYPGGYLIHHLFMGVALVIPAAFLLAFEIRSRRLAVSTRVALGMGSAMILDEITFLVATQASDADYVSRISFLGGLGFVALAVIMLGILYRCRSAAQRK